MVFASHTINDTLRRVVVHVLLIGVNPEYLRVLEFVVNYRCPGPIVESRVATVAVGYAHVDPVTRAVKVIVLVLGWFYSGISSYLSHAHSVTTTLSSILEN